MRGARNIEGNREAAKNFCARVCYSERSRGISDSSQKMFELLAQNRQRSRREPSDVDELVREGSLSWGARESIKSAALRLRKNDFAERPINLKELKEWESRRS
jgi:hypothetical protein